MRLPGSGRRGSARGEKLPLAMTPMIDVVFNLLIFFMLMPSFEKTEGFLPTNLPDFGPGPETPAPLPEFLRIDLLHVEPLRDHPGEAVVRLNGEVLQGGAAELRTRLRAARARLASDGGKAEVLIAPDMAVWHRHVVMAFDAAVDAGFKAIRFTVPQ